MKRRFNYTGRYRIPREKISIMLNRDGGSVRSFTVTLDLNGMNLPPDAKVYIDTYHRTEYKRFDFGTAGNITPPPSASLFGLAYTENLKFRILVVDKSSHQHGLILAHTDRLSPISEEERKPILPVEFRDLGQQIYRVDFAGDEDSPVLIINDRIPNIENISKSDPQFIIYVYPAVIREILTHMIFVDGVDSPADPAIDWHKDWLDFSRTILPGEGHPGILDPKDENFETESAKNWIDKVVEEFCSSRNEWKEYINQLVDGGER